MDSEALLILRYLKKINPTKRAQLKSYVRGNKFGFFTLVSAIATFFLGLVFSVFTEYQVFGKYLVFICFGMFALYGFSSVLTTFKSIFDYRQETIVSLEEQYKYHLKHVFKLRTFSLAGLELVHELLEERIEFITKRTGFIVGAIEKLGIIPALLMMYVTYKEISIAPTDNSLHWIFASFVVGVYIGAILARATVDYLESTLCIIKLALKEKSQMLNSHPNKLLKSDG